MIGDPPDLEVEYWYDIWERYVSFGPEMIKPDSFGVSKGHKKILLDCGYNLEDCISVVLDLPEEQCLLFLLGVSREEIDRLPIEILDCVITKVPKSRWDALDLWNSSGARSWENFRSLTERPHHSPIGCENPPDVAEASLRKRMKSMLDSENSPATRCRMVNAIFEAPITETSDISKHHQKRHDYSRAVTSFMIKCLETRQDTCEIADFKKSMDLLLIHGGLLLPSSNLVLSVLLDVLWHMRHYYQVTIQKNRAVLNALLAAPRQQESERNATSDSALMTCCKLLVLCSFGDAANGINTCLYCIMRLLKLGCDPPMQNNGDQTAREYLEGLKALKDLQHLKRQEDFDFTEDRRNAKDLQHQNRLPIFTGLRQMFPTWSSAHDWQGLDLTPWRIAIGMLEQCEESRAQGMNVEQAFDEYIRKYPKKRSEYGRLDALTWEPMLE